MRILWLEFYDDLMMASAIRQLDIFNDPSILNVPCHQEREGDRAFVAALLG